MTPIYQVFGSESSRDLDVIFFIDSLKGTIKENKELVTLYSKEIISEKEVNGNLAVLENGIIKECFKGTPDEVNNSCFYTYDLHPQKYPKQILEITERDIYLKVARTIRVLLSFLSKSEYRNLVKDALKSGNTERYKILKSINLRTIKSFGKNLSDIEIAKTIAFQLGQTLLLLSGIEVYTKEKIGTYYPDLIPFLERRENPNFGIIQIYLDFFIALIKYKIRELPIEVLKK